LNNLPELDLMNIYHKHYPKFENDVQGFFLKNYLSELMYFFQKIKRSKRHNDSNL